MYERFFGLADTPFRLTPDPRYLFLSRRHADALAHLKLGLTESSGFVCITGDVGTGKTTLLRYFLSTLGPEVSTAYVFNPALTATELLQTINAEFGLPAQSTSKKELLQALNAHLLAQHEEGRRAIVVVDEAQALDLEVLEQLRLLSNLETTTEKLLRIILVGQPQLGAMLLHPDLAQLNQRITLRWHIGPLARRESAAYVAHRIDVASGEPGRRLFSRRALRLLHRHAGGVPRLINMMAHRSLLAAYAAGRQRVTGRSVTRAHREISTLPLPGRRARPPRRWPRLAATAAATAMATVAAVWMGARAPWREAAWRQPPVPVAAAPDPSPAPPPTTLPDPAPPSPPAPPGPPSAEAIAWALAEETPADSAHTAMAGLLEAWSAEPLAESEVRGASDFAQAAERRGFEHVVLKGNASMLRLLDVPAVLELHFPGGGGMRYASLLGIEDDRWTLATPAGRITVGDDFLARYWYGYAHLVWRDVEHLGPTDLGPGASGSAVVRLQTLLGRTGLYTGPATGIFDQATTEAVVAFQRAHFLEADGWVGPLTRVALYAETATHDRPSLAQLGMPGAAS